MTGANAHDVTQIEAVLEAIMVKRPTPKQRRSKHPCADASYRGKSATAVILAMATSRMWVVAKAKRRRKRKIPTRRPGAGWFNRFRKLLMRYEKLEHTFLTLNHLVAAIIALRKIRLPVNIIYG